MDGLKPLSASIFDTVYLPGPWTEMHVYWDLAFLWMFFGIVVVAVSTRQR